MVEATVRNVCPFGVFLDIGAAGDARLHAPGWACVLSSHVDSRKTIAFSSPPPSEFMGLRRLPGTKLRLF